MAKILKRPAGIEFDTDRPDQYRQFRHISEADRAKLVPLHHTHAESDREYLSRYFAPNHLIFENFGDSYYFLIEGDTKPSGS